MCRSLGSPKGRNGGQAHLIPRNRTEGLGDGSRDGGKVHPRPCSDLVNHLGLHLPGPSEEPSWDASGSSSPGRRGGHRGVVLTPTALLHRALTLCVSTCGACGNMLPNSLPRLELRARSTRDLEMIPGRLLSPAPRAAEPSPHFCPNLPRKTVLSAFDSLSAIVSLRLQSALPFLPEDVSSYGHHLSDTQIMSFTPSFILCKFPGNSNLAQTSPGYGSEPSAWIQNHSVSIPMCPQTLRAGPHSAQ